MSSHHIQSHSDPNYLVRLQNLRIGSGGGGSGHGGDESPNRRTHSLNGSIATIDAISKDGNGYNHLPHTGLSNAADYKIYERNNILTASKLNNTNSKLTQNFVAPQTNLAKGYLCGGYIINNSPTHSLSGSSQHSGSPRTSLNAAIGNSNLLYDPKLATVPVYENIDYYGTTTSSIAGAVASQAGPQQPYPHLHPHHQHANQPHKPTPAHFLHNVNGVLHTADGVLHTGGGNSSNGCGSGGASFDSTYKRAEPQVSTNVAGRFAHTPQPPDVATESTPIYENVLSVTGNNKVHQKQNDVSNVSICF